MPKRSGGISGGGLTLACFPPPDASSRPLTCVDLPALGEVKECANACSMLELRDAEEPSTTAISLRLPLSLLESIKIEANKRDVPYQSLIKTWRRKLNSQRRSKVTKLKGRPLVSFAA
jgi:hypothetical protein